MLKLKISPRLLNGFMHSVPGCKLKEMAVEVGNYFLIDNFFRCFSVTYPLSNLFIPQNQYINLTTPSIIQHNPPHSSTVIPTIPCFIQNNYAFLPYSKVRCGLPF